ncbi:endonuclease-reverse transcriptase [Lasius niger]|uniref:Endonuclease-reverse transcriptase n=1 Tax=Lasius niger TaxID=67767 RepID=A0A0J7K8A5_LASNI|nr:endonuclease-reverse transcriptase [Lasius niger]
MSDETLALIEKRLNIRLSNADPDQMEKVNNKIKRSCGKNKNEHISKICTELDRHANENRSTELYSKVKYLSREFKAKTQIIKDEQGNVITDAKGIAKMWREYCCRLFHDEPPPASGNRTQLDQKPAILRDEVGRAVKKLRNQKALGSDGITAEVFNLG